VLRALLIETEIKKNSIKAKRNKRLVREKKLGAPDLRQKSNAETQ
jgi:hypothetical protein